MSRTAHTGPWPFHPTPQCSFSKADTHFSFFLCNQPVKVTFMSVDQFIVRLRDTPTSQNVANPYSCYTENIDATPEAFCQRSLQLSTYLRHRQVTARIILVAEAPGYQGARFSGIAMTSERLLSGARDFVAERDILGQERLFRRTSHDNACRNQPERLLGFVEPTATIVWEEIMGANRANEVVLWNTFPFHPHRDGNPLSNRKPSNEEIAVHAEILGELRTLFNAECRTVAVGNLARDHLQLLGVEAHHIRHPANGGAPEFRQGFRQLFDAD